MGLRGNRVLYFRRQIDFLLSNLSIPLLVALAAAIPLIALLVIAAISIVSNEQQIGLVSGNWAAFYISLISSATISVGAALLARARTVKASALKIKRLIYQKLRRRYSRSGASSCEKQLILRIIRLLLHNVYLNPDQIKAMNEILEHLCGQGHRGRRVLWLVGPGFSGKTTVIASVLVAIADDSRYADVFSQIDRQIRYFDFSRDAEGYRIVANQIGSDTFERQLVVIDNAHRLPSNELFSLLAKVFNAKTYATIIATRLPIEFLDQTYQVDKLDRLMNDCAVKLQIREQYGPDEGTAIPQELEHTNLEFDKAVQVHISNMDESSLVAQDFIKCMIGKFIDPEKKQLFIAVVASCLFSGNVRAASLYEMVKTPSAKRYLRDMGDTNIVRHCLDEDGDYYELHENLAKSYALNTYRRDAVYYQQCFDFLLSSESISLFQKMLYSKLVGREGRGRQYDQVFNDSNFQVLKASFDFIVELDCSCEERCFRERGIIYDRLGELEKATEQYWRYYEREGSADALLKAIQVDHAIYPLEEEKVSLFCESHDSEYDRLLALYWRVHIDMHRGIFSFEQMRDIISDMSRHAEEIISIEPYSGLHLLRRGYFDYFRTYYLCGILDGFRLEFLIDSVIRTVLERLPEFDAYQAKFVYGHYLHYDVLFLIGSLDEVVCVDEVKKVAKACNNEYPHDYVTADNVTNAALESYQRAMESMERFGDKTAMFVKCRYHEVKITQGVYVEAERFYDEFLEFANRENNAYYRGCAFFYRAKAMLVKMLDPRHVTDSRMRNWNGVHDILARALDEFHKADPENPYVDVNIGVCEAVASYIESGAHSKEKGAIREFTNTLVALRVTCKQHRYDRQLRLLDRLECRHGETLTFIDCWNIMRYYPFVAQ